MNEKERIPKVIKESKIDIQGMKIKVYVLDNGKRVIPTKDYNKILNFLGISKEEFAKLMAKQKGGSNG